MAYPWFLWLLGWLSLDSIGVTASIGPAGPVAFGAIGTGVSSGDSWAGTGGSAGILIGSVEPSLGLAAKTVIFT